MTSSLYQKNEFKRLCSIVGSKPEELEYILAHIDNYYNEWSEEKIDKKTGSAKKYKDGTIKKRTFRPSLARLKTIQAAIKNKILATIDLPENIQGGIKGKSNITNAKNHQGHKFQFTTDLQEFYPNIKHGQVYKMYISLGFGSHFSSWLTKLTTQKSQLPQGAPTSQHIANLVFLKTDKELIQLCEEKGVVYTRFVDDLTFSSSLDFKSLLNSILGIITNHGFKINYRKTKYAGYQTITGIKVHNNFIDAPSAIKEKADMEKDIADSNKPYTNYLKRIRAAKKHKTERGQ